MKKAYADLRVLTGSHLKLLAVLLMGIDHVAGFLLREVESVTEVLFTVGHREVTLYFLMRFVGRWAFPLFAFLIVEGFLHTHDRLKYGRNLLLFALLSEIPWNLVHSHTFFYPSQNVFFTLFIGYIGLCAIERFRGENLKLGASLISLLVISVFLRADYGCSGYGFILLMYVLRKWKLLMSVIGSCILPSRWMAGFAFIPICMYNGRRGFVKGSVAKYAFYLFYPLHLLLLYVMSNL